MALAILLIVIRIALGTAGVGSAFLAVKVVHDRFFEGYRVDLTDTVGTIILAILLICLAFMLVLGAVLVTI